MPEQRLDERKQTGASYIFAFYDSIMQLNDTYSQYICVMVEYRERYPDLDSLDNVDDAAKAILLQHIQNVRYLLNKSYIFYTTIATSLKIPIKEDLVQMYQNTKAKALIEASLLEAFVIEMNKVLVDEVVKELLTRASDMSTSLYSQNAGIS